jgi:hypothetical protein
VIKSKSSYLIGKIESVQEGASKGQSSKAKYLAEYVLNIVISTKHSKQVILLTKEGVESLGKNLRDDEIIFAFHDWSFIHDKVEEPVSVSRFEIEQYLPGFQRICFQSLGPYQKSFGPPLKKAPSLLEWFFDIRVSPPCATWGDGRPMMPPFEWESDMGITQMMELLGADNLFPIATTRLVEKNVEHEIDTLWQYIEHKDLDAIDIAQIGDISRNLMFSPGDSDLSWAKTFAFLNALQLTNRSVWIPGEQRFGIPSIADKKRSRKAIQITVDFAQLIEKIAEKGLILKTIECPKCGGKIEVPTSGNVVKCVNCGKDFYAIDVWEKFKGLL